MNVFVGKTDRPQNRQYFIFFPLRIFFTLMNEQPARRRNVLQECTRGEGKHERGKTGFPVFLALPLLQSQTVVSLSPVVRQSGERVHLEEGERMPTQL